MDRAKIFYEHMLGTKLDIHDMGKMHMAWFPMMPDAIGATGTLVKAEAYVPSTSGTVIYFNVLDIEGTLKLAQEKGGKVCLAKTNIGEHGFIAHLEDCEGNRIALHSRT